MTTYELAMEIINAEMELRVKDSMIQAVVRMCRENPDLWVAVQQAVNQVCVNKGCKLYGLAVGPRGCPSCEVEVRHE